MKSLIFNSGPIINLAMNNLLWVMQPLKEKFDGEFYITDGVYKEIVEKPLQSKKYKFESLQILHLISTGILQMYETETIHNYAQNLTDLMNKCFKAHDRWINIVQFAEIETISCAKHIGSQTIVIDERTTRKMIENIDFVADNLRKKLHTNIIVNRENIEKVKKELKDLHVLRSTELFAMAYELGFITKDLTKDEKKRVKNINKEILEGGLWALKLNGASITENEINDIISSSSR